MGWRRAGCGRRVCAAVGRGACLGSCAAMASQLAKAAGVAGRCQAQHPPTLQMVKEALRAHDEKKGASVVAIKRFILAKYPSVDPIRLKYLLKQALSKGLSCGELVRPHNSSAVGATGTFKLARKKQQHKKQLGQADSDRAQPRKPGQKGITKGPVAGAQQPGATKQPKAKPVKAKPRAAQKASSDRAKLAQAAEQPQARGTGPAGPPRAAGHRQGPRKGRPAPSTALAAESTGGSDSDSDSSASSGTLTAGVKGPPKAPRGKSKGKVPKGAQQNAPKAQGGQDQARKPRVTPGAGQEKKPRQKKAAPLAAGKKVP